MPCRSYDDDNCNSSYNEINTLKNKIDKLSIQLCDAYRTLENSNIEIPSSGTRWWKLHKKEDDIRLELERKEKERLELEKKKEDEIRVKRSEVIAKLTPEEIEILGLG